MGDTTPDLSTLEFVGRHLYKPILHLTHKGERRIETVRIKYEHNQYKAIEGSPALAVAGQAHIFGNAKYIRAWVNNVRGFTAQNCQVFIERIWLGNRLLDDERTLLTWTDLPETYTLEEMRKGYRQGHYIDICASDSCDPRLKIISQRQLRGYHMYPDHGTYTLELCAEARKPCHSGRFMIKVKHTGNPDGLHVVTTREGSDLFNWGWNVDPKNDGFSILETQDQSQVHESR
jgi:hypothetical protein